MLRPIFAALALCSISGPALAQFVVEGVLHDSESLSPIDDAVLLVLDDATGEPVSPGMFRDPAQQGQITGPSGRYRIDVLSRQQIRLTFERPDSRFLFPSVIAPPPSFSGERFGGVACAEIPCPTGEIDPSSVPVPGATYALRFDPEPSQSARNNHVPVDALGGLVDFELVSDRQRAHLGETVAYVLRIGSRSPDPIPDAELSIAIPKELRFREARGSRRGLDGGEEPIMLSPRQADLQIRIPVPLDPGSEMSVRLIASVAGPIMGTPRVVTRAALERSGGILLAEAESSLLLSGDPTLDTSIILGSVFCESEGGRGGFQDANEPGLYGARVYLDTGFYVESDARGLFSFTGVPPGTRLLKLDPSSLPPRSEVLTPIRQILYLSPGTPAKVRFGVACVFERWTPARVDRAAVKANIARKKPPASRSISFGIDAATWTATIGERRERFLEAELDGELTPNGVRFFPRSIGPITPSRWTIQLTELDENGVEVRAIRSEELTGRGYPPLFVEIGVAAPSVGHVFRARLELDAAEIDGALSPSIDVGIPLPPVAQMPEQIGRVAEADLERGMAAILPILEERLTADRLVVIEGHWDDAPDALERSKDLAMRASAIIAKVNMEVIARGAEAPLFPNLVRRMRLQNRRVDIFLKSRPVSPRGPPRPDVEPRHAVLVIDKRSATLDLVATDRVAATMELDVPARVEIVLYDGRGGVSRISRVVTHDWVLRPGMRKEVDAFVVPDRRVVDLGPVEMPLPTLEVSVREVRRREGGVELRLADTGGVVRWMVAAVDPRTGRVAARAAGSGEPSEVIELATTSTSATEIRFAAEYPGQIQRVGLLPRKDGVELYGLARSGPIEASERVLSIGGGLIVPLPEIEAIPRAVPPSEVVEVSPDPKSIDAADLEIEAPGGVLERASLPITGRTKPTNVVRINGERVAVDGSGAFAYTLPLEPGDNRVRIESSDPAGNRAVVERTVSTSSTTWFLMAMADSSAALGGVRLSGSNDHTHVDAGPFGLDGRITAYGRAAFAVPGPFDEIEILGRIDTGEQGDSSVLRLSDDPLRLLPAFGDASLEVQDTASRYKGYLELAFDQSTLVVGNASTELAPFGAASLFAFRRSGFGLHTDFTKSFSTFDETHVEGGYAFENGGLRRGHDEIQGTGGTMYWLSHDEIVEGSARVTLVVRDRDTGMILTSLEADDYELRPREGRISFREPVSHVTGIGAVGINRTVALGGHPIYIVADYEYLADAADDRRFGVEVKETLFDRVELYFGAAGEDRTDGDHRLFGGGIAWRPAPGTFVELEYARSSGRTGLGSLSVDGGLSYRGLDRDQASIVGQSAPFFGGLGEDAIGAAGHLDLSDVAAGSRGFIHAYGRRVGLGYSSLSIGRDQGRLAGGVAATYSIIEPLRVRAGFDAASTVVPEAASLGEAASVVRMLGVVGIDYRDEDNGASLDFAHLRTALAPQRGASSSTGIAAIYERRLIDPISISLGQEALFGADALTGGGLGRFATTGGISFDLTDALRLSLFETVRWSGDNATQLGLRVKTGDGASAYVAERLSHAGGQPRLATIVGAEEAFGEGSRSYGELQMDGGAHPDRVRAVLGMDNRWRVAEGVDLLLSYERAQLTGGTPVPNLESPSRFEAPFGGVSATLGGFGDVVSFLPGAVSRDALAVGITWTGLSALKLAQRLELRADNADRAGGADYLILGSRTGVTAKISRDITALGDLVFQNARDTTNDRTYARVIEGSIAAIYRPRFEDWFTLVLRYTKIYAKRPEALDPIHRSMDRDAFSAEPIFDTPWNVQLVERVALVRDRTTIEGFDALPATLLILWINRVNARFFEVLEAGVEYRMLTNLDLDTTDRGFLIEAGYLPVPYVRLGLGYNFTKFSDDLFEPLGRDASGPFLRVTALY